MIRLILLIAVLSGCGKPGPTAILETSMGTIVIQLDARKAPGTVANFVALAKGEKEWQKKKAKLYDGLTIHRVIPKILIQMGDPKGDGSGDLGFTIPDENLGKFDKAGLVGMANFGKNTGMGQFFITLSPQPDLNGRHAIFGHVVAGMDVVEKISNVPRDESFGRDKPLKPVFLKSVTIKD
jgi:peptidyl-prolyl cis-trans isomerase A (cyclophilin A)